MKIGIIGAGITGLTTAIALKKMGLTAHLYERVESLSPHGAGIWLQPNALKVLKWLGLLDQVTVAGSRIQEAMICDKALKPLGKSVALSIPALKEYGIISIHRGRLQQVLLGALGPDKPVLSSPYQHHREHKDHLEVQAGKEYWQADALLAADGLHSAVRERLFPAARLRYAGQTCWRGISQIKLPAHLDHKGIEAWGPDARFGFAPISDHEVYWFAVSKSKPGQKDEPEHRKNMLLQRFSAFHALVNQIIEQTPEAATMRHDIWDLKRLPTWSKGKVCLLGDAAHATTPNMGQGGCQGIEDAFYISQLLAKANAPEAAFEQFEQQRRKKTDYVVKNSWLMGKMAHSTLGQPLMKLMMRSMPPKAMQKQLESLYSLQPV